MDHSYSKHWHYALANLIILVLRCGFFLFRAHGLAELSSLLLFLNLEAYIKDLSLQGRLV